MTERDTLREHLAKAGAIGGRKTGKSKVRGDGEYYRKLSSLAQKARSKSKKKSS